MLNKELLMMSTQGKRNVKLTIGHFSNSFGDVYGYLNSHSNRFGSLDLLPYWGTTGNVITQLSYGTLTKNTIFNAPSGVTVFVAGYPQHISAGDSLDLDPYSMLNSEGSTRYLTFDPPHWLLGSKNTQTDLRRGYYVEEVPWEAQDAEQGTSDDGRRRGVVDSTIQVHRGLLYRSIPRGSNRSAAYSLGRKSEYGYCNDSNTSKEYPTTYTHWRSLHEHTRKWVYNRILQRTRNNNHSVSKRGISRVRIRRMISKEALYA